MLNHLPQAARQALGSRAGVSAQSRLTPLGTEPRLGVQLRAQRHQQPNRRLPMGSSRAPLPPRSWGPSCSACCPPHLVLPHTETRAGPGQWGQARSCWNLTAWLWPPALGVG